MRFFQVQRDTEQSVYTDAFQLFVFQIPMYSYTQEKVLAVNETEESFF